MDIPQLVVIAAGIPWLAYLMIRPRILTLLVIFLALVQLNWFARYYSAPAVFGRLSLAVAGLLGVRLLADLVVKKKSFPKKLFALGPVLLLTLFLLTLTLFSNLYNRESLLLGFYELRYYYFGFVVFLALYFYYNERLTITYFKKMMIWLGLIQVPVSIVKWIVARGGEAITLDAVSGTFSNYGELVACQIIAIGIVLYEELNSRKRLLQKNNYLLCLALIIPLLLSKSRTATLFVALIISFTWALSSLRKRNLAVVLKQTVLISVLGVSIIFLFYQFFWKANYDLQRYVNFSYVFSYFMRDPVKDYERYKSGSNPVMGRFRAVAEATAMINRHPFNLFIGYGSGSTAEASFLHKTGKLYQSYGPLAGLGRNHYSKVIAEYGLLGLASFILFYTLLFFRLNSDVFAKKDYKIVYMLLLFSLALLSIYTNTLTSFFYNFTLAFFLATIQADYDRINDSGKLNRQ